jgi:hypothetical protein
MNDGSRIYVDAGRPATLNDGAAKLTDCPTLQEAVLAWRALPSEQKVRATVKVIGGPVYTAHQAEASMKRRFRPPLDQTDACFFVKDHNGQARADRARPKSGHRR